MLVALALAAAGPAAAPAPAAEPAGPPVLRADGPTLEWEAIDGVDRYVLAIIPEHGEREYEVVEGTRATPPSVPGAVVTYGLRADVPGSAWADEVSIAYGGHGAPAHGAPAQGAPALVAPAHGTPPPKEPPVAAEPGTPVLRLEGSSLRWEPVEDAPAYVLATKVPGRSTRHEWVQGTSHTPPAVPGQAVTYGLRTDVPGSAWAVELIVQYSPSGLPVSARYGEAPPAGGDALQPPAQPDRTREPAPLPAPTGVVATPPAGLVVGMTNGGSLDAKGSAGPIGRLGARYARIEFGIGRSAAELRDTIAAYAARGVRVLPLAGFHGRVPSAAEARNLGSWAREFGPGGSFWQGRSDGHLAWTDIEFGNETSYSYQGTQGRGAEYAQRFRDAHAAVKAANPRVGLLAQADDGGCGCNRWVSAMFDAVPNLDDLVSGWTVHAYGPESRAFGRIDRLVSQTAAEGASSGIPIHNTEYGFATDDARCLSDNYSWDKCQSYAEAADGLRTMAAKMKQRYGARLRSLYLYQATDQRDPGATGEREHYFGALTRSQGDKGPFTAAVRALLASSPAPR